MTSGLQTNKPLSLGDAVARDLQTFELRCWARAYLVVHGMMRLQEAVDGLQDAAVSAGLVTAIGQDEVQAIMTTAFEPRRGQSW